MLVPTTNDPARLAQQASPHGNRFEYQKGLDDGMALANSNGDKESKECDAFETTLNDDFDKIKVYRTGLSKGAAEAARAVARAAAWRCTLALLNCTQVSTS